MHPAPSLLHSRAFERFQGLDSYAFRESYAFGGFDLQDAIALATAGMPPFAPTGSGASALTICAFEARIWP